MWSIHILRFIVDECIKIQQTPWSPDHNESTRPTSWQICQEWLNGCSKGSYFILGWHIGKTIVSNFIFYETKMLLSLCILCNLRRYICRVVFENIIVYMYCNIYNPFRIYNSSFNCTSLYAQKIPLLQMKSIQASIFISWQRSNVLIFYVTLSSLYLMSGVSFCTTDFNEFNLYFK